ncbi:ROK family protein [Variovorax sp. PCZ-1]|uniref:ROK family protein n=1 Tax=Variovorax sp. PCZ-1 TaxID=2835533 RepID=UPI001BCBBB1D|nr:ROK family protein [Variovorax sp. PCZ-1]MBS7806100.1 ROK family protein [Variovorax sp. PCZ-1]
MNSLHACVDIGGTKVAVSLADAQSAATRTLHARIAEPTAKEGANDALAQQILRLIDASLAQMGALRSQVQSVGISSCGPFVLNQGLVELAAPNVCGGLAGKARGLPNDWQTALLQAPIAAIYPNVRVENDCIGALEAERQWGALQGMSHCAYVTWSTGIGMGLCVDGHVLRGKNGNAGHAGHMFVSDNNDALCGCGNIGDLEGLVAGNAMERRFRSDAATIFIAARAGNTPAKAQIESVSRDMGRALYNLIVTLDLQRISLGGSVFWHNQDMLLPLLQREIDGKLPSLTDGCELVPAGLGLQVGDFGALALTRAAASAA